MKTLYTKLSLVTMLVFLGMHFSFGQTTIYTQDFETLNSGYTASATEGTPGSDTDIFNRSNPNIGGNSTFIWAVEDTNSTPANITLDQIDISGYSDFTFSIDLLAHHYLDWDSTDEMNITYSIDGGAPQNLLSVQSTVAGDDFNTPAALDTDFDGEGDCSAGNILPALSTGTEGGCTVSSDQFATFSSSTIALAGNSTLDITITFEGLTSADEGIYLDNIEVVGTSATTDTQVQFDSASTSVNEDAGTASIDLSILNEDASNPTSVEVALTSGNATDINNYTTQTITFPAGSAANQTLTVDITDNATDEADKNLTFTLQNVSGGNNAQIGAQNTFDLTIVDDDLAAPITLPYTEDFSNCSTAEWITFDEAGGNSWSCGSGEFAMNGFDGGGATLDDIDWLISDFRINFDDYSSVSIDVTTAEQFGDATNQAGEFRLVYSTDYDGLGDPSTGTWTELTFDPNNTSTGFGTSTPSTTTVDASSVSGTAFIAFIYDETQGNGSEDWRVQQVDITGVPATSNSADSDIAVTAFDPTDNIDYTLYSATSALTTANAIKVGEFTIRDGGATNSDSDSQSTTLTDVTIDITNFDNLAAIAIFDGTSNLSEITSVTASNSFSSLSLEAADDSNKTFEIYVTFNSSVVDNAQLQYTISSATADVAGSLFTDVDAGGAVTSITGDDNKIEVTATDLLFNQDATDVGVGNVMTPSPTVEAYDTNLNLDLDFTGNVALSPTGTTFDGTATTTVAAVAGVATFSNLVFDVTATGATLEASSGALTTDTSSAFDVIIAPIVIAQEDFDGSTPSWSYTNDIPFFDNGTDGSYGIFTNAAPLSNTNFSGNVLFENDLDDEGDNGTSGFATVTFEEISVENFSNVVLSFDWEVIDYNANADDAKYEIIVDGVSNGEVFLVDGGVDPTDGSGTVTYNVPVATSTISLLVSVRNNGASGYSAFDNIKIEGNYDGDLVYSGGTWTPSAPSGSTGTNDVLVQDGTYTTNGDISVNSISVLGDAAVEVRPADILTVNSSINNNGDFTFQSDLSGVGQLDDFSGSITGDITVERFIPAKRAFRLISSAVDGSSIANAWQQDTHITGTGGSTNGFDATSTNNPSMFTFDNTITNQSSGAGWQAVTSTTDVISAGTPYRLMVRGDRSIDLTDNEAPATATTLSVSGSLHTGSYTPTLATAANNYSFVGNPYQAVVDFGAVTKSNLTDFIYVWDASVAGSNGNGGYITVQISTGNITAPSPSSSDASQYIAPGQAFFVQNNATGNGSITFNEADKATGQAQVSIFSTYTNFYINSRLYKASALQNGEMESDAIGLRFNENYTTVGSDEDASKLANPGENYAIVNNGFKSIDKQNIPTDGHQIDLLMMNYEDTAYSLSFNLGNQPETLKVYLNDNYLNTQTELTESITYDFTVDANVPESIDQNRFHLSFEEVPLNNQSFDAGQVRLYPNPVAYQLQIELPASVEINSVQVFNTLGQKVLTTTQSQVDVSQLASGVYVVELETSAGKV
ncbi:Por secretion system C-terminal sorting domain-containing protein, partial [Psychroflexus salarius]